MCHFLNIWTYLFIFSLGFAIAFMPSLSYSASGQNMMQCMSKCIQHEGGNSATNRNICKSRCAKVSIGGGKQRNCIAEFKSCRKGCGKLKKCYRACKEKQMACR